MATTFSYKVLGQAFPTTTAETTLYTTPALTQTIAATLMITNQTSAPQSFSVAVKPGGGAVASKNYIYFNVVVNGNDTLDLTTALTLATTDVISVFCTAGSTLSFNLFGTEYA